MSTPTHFFSVDVEDWPQSTLDHSLPIGERVVANTEGVLEIFIPKPENEDAKQVKVTIE